MAERAPLLILLLLVLAGAAFFLLTGGGSEERGDAAEGVPPADRQGAPTPADAPPTASDPGAEPGAAPADPTPAEPSAPQPPEPEETPWPLPPEMLSLPVVRWEEARARDVLDDIARQTGLEIRMSGAVEDKLENMKVTLELENTKGSHVLTLVLQPHELNYTVRDGVLTIFVDDD